MTYVEPDVTSARAIIDRILGEFGLESLSGWAWEQLKTGVPTELIFLDMRDRPEYKARFPAIKSLAEKGRAISEAEYIAYEKQVTQTMRAAGLPVGFYDQPDDFARFLESELSPAEVESRIQLAQQAAFSSPVDVRFDLERMYGIGPGDLVAFWLDPDKALPLLQQRFVSAEIGTASRRAGYGLLTAAEAERLGAVGLDAAQAGQGFGELAQLGEAFGALTQGETDIDRQTQLQLLEGNTEAMSAVQTRQKRRVASYEAGGQFTETQEGVSGIGKA